MDQQLDKIVAEAGKLGELISQTSVKFQKASVKVLVVII